MANDTAKRLLARVREIREALGLSQEAFSERAGLKYKHYQALEAGRKNEFHFSTVEKLAKACGLEPWELLNFDSTPAALAEDRAEGGSASTPAKAARKAAPRRAGERKATGEASKA